MRLLQKQREYKLVDYMENEFPLSINKYNEDNHVLHVHDFIELVIVESGKGIHYTKNFRHVIVAGDVLTIPKGMKHGYKDSETLEITNIIFDMSLLDSLAEDFKHIPGFHSLFLLNPLQQQRIINKKGFLTLDPNEIARIKRLTSRITSEQQEKRTGYRSVCILALADLIIFLSRKASKHNLTHQTKNLAAVLSYMEKKYDQHISLEQLSEMVNLSPRSFQRIFNAYMGISPFSHLINIRMQHAKKLLKETEFTVGEIAYLTGFGDSAYFTRQFKKIFRTPPSKYRKQVKIN
jgi:AraC-like DNA-binding protein